MRHCGSKPTEWLQPHCGLETTKQLRSHCGSRPTGAALAATMGYCGAPYLAIGYRRCQSGPYRRPLAPASPAAAATPRPRLRHFSPPQHPCPRKPPPPQQPTSHRSPTPTAAVSHRPPYCRPPQRAASPTRNPPLDRRFPYACRSASPYTAAAHHLATSVPPASHRSAAH
ncbi:uncharacterized protein LOC131858414 [Cryptomeria japonica]|uniref:uncharacterized protein LOC131858414 n=1 Tax=Cryptomeria japonica TaxID=3369 RepID=UPI0027DA46C6|nr:uncharacterized protein LOC131858414 [Cryptomeria japonica]